MRRQERGPLGAVHLRVELDETVDMADEPPDGFVEQDDHVERIVEESGIPRPPLRVQPSRARCVSAGSPNPISGRPSERSWSASGWLRRLRSESSSWSKVVP